jgi:hypothetical protein
MFDNKYFMLIFACLTLGLAPFTPEPHIVGKIRWILGGAHGMTLVDWGDTLMHGLPWVALLFVGLSDLLKKANR